MNGSAAPHAIVFAGPTLPAAEAARELAAEYRPPAGQGDVYRAALCRPRAIGIVDGYFGMVPAVWHKEVLWAMQAGIHVFGSASMGALRAAELAAFGMEGVGTIFEAYARGELEDDDEVAIVHAPAENGYRPLSDAMVNIRATLAAAEAQGVIGPAARAALLLSAKARFYAERTYARMLADGAERGLDPRELDALAAWLPRGAVDQKRADALAMLGRMRERLAAGLVPKQVRYHFEHTIYWEHVCATAGAVEADGDWLPGAILDEARLAGDAYQLARRGACTRALAETLAGQQGQRAEPAAVAEAITAFRRARGLLESDEMAAWLAANDLDAERFAALLATESQVRGTVIRAAPNLTARMLDQLRLDGTYARLTARARDKQRILEEHGRGDPGLAGTGLTHAALLEWYFSRRGAEVPADPVLYARDAGFRDEHAFIRALLREYYYAELAGSSVGAES